jgi:hypothetical protein
MNPTQPQQPMPPAAPPPSQFDFIMNSGTPVREKGTPGGKNNGQQKRILIVLAGVAVLIVLAIAFKTITSSKGKGDIQTLTTIAAEQTELIRVSDLGISQAKFISNRNVAATVSVSLQTNKRATLRLLANSDQKVLNSRLGSKKNTKVDVALADAITTNSVDDTFHGLLLASLVSYRNSLKNAYATATVPKEKQVLGDAYNGVNLILNSQTTNH